MNLQCAAYSFIRYKFLYSTVSQFNFEVAIWVPKSTYIQIMCEIDTPFKEANLILTLERLFI